MSFVDLREAFSVVIGVQMEYKPSVRYVRTELLPIPPESVAYIRHACDVMMRRRWGSVLPRRIVKR